MASKGSLVRRGSWPPFADGLNVDEEIRARQPSSPGSHIPADRATRVFFVDGQLDELYHLLERLAAIAVRPFGGRFGTSTPDYVAFRHDVPYPAETSSGCHVV